MPNKTAEIEAILGQSTSKRKWLWPVIIGTGLVLAAGGLWLWWPGTGAQRAPQYVTQAIDRGDVTVTVTATGSVEPTNVVEISTELSGTVRAVNFDFNDIVKAGDVLAQLDTATLEANLTRARANVDAAEARLAESQATLEEMDQAYERSLQLADKGVASDQMLLSAKSNFSRATAALQSATANVAIAKADLALNEANLAKACICAPIDGIILDRNVEIGQILAASFSAPTLFTLAEDLARMQLQVDIDEADIGLVSEGDRAYFTVEAFQNKTFPAEIAELRFAPLTVNGVVTYKAILAVDNTDLLLRPGMTATATITVAETPDVLRVPNAALRFTPTMTESLPADTAGQKTVWVLRNDQAEPVTIEPGSSDGSFTVIVSGALAAGDRVIVDAGPN